MSSNKTCKTYDMAKFMNVCQSIHCKCRKYDGHASSIQDVQFNKMSKTHKEAMVMIYYSSMQALEARTF